MSAKSKLSKKIKKLGEVLEENFKTENLILAEIKKEYDKRLQKEILKTLQQIAIGEELNYDELKQKYGKKKSKNKKKETLQDNNNEKNDILDCINLDGNTYWVNRSEGLIYNEETKIIGKVEGNNYVLNS
tara:strand:- start:292 stop:681 length:390 start_codon:yes stop_codon:yes gene_type:complete